jgi:hypothetical protein
MTNIFKGIANWQTDAVMTYLTYLKTAAKLKNKSIATQNYNVLRKMVRLKYMKHPDKFLAYISQIYKSIK